MSPLGYQSTNFVKINRRELSKDETIILRIFYWAAFFGMV